MRPKCPSKVTTARTSHIVEFVRLVTPIWVDHVHPYTYISTSRVVSDFNAFHILRTAAGGPHGKGAPPAEFSV